MIKHTELSNTELKDEIRKKKINFGGNGKLKIYGLLTCISGKRMKKKNRVFFADEKEALQNQYRPCGHCMKEAYKTWKDRFVQSSDK